MQGLLIEIEECNRTNPAAFWNYIKKLGPNHKTSIPWEVETENGTSTDRDIVLEVWCNSFEKLYNKLLSTFYDQFKESILGSSDLNTSTVTESNQWLNAEITYGEVKKAVEHSENKKATGVDHILNELL